ncbi:MAG: GNAT family N-acetyltransferase [Gemmobacter sp.]
MQDQSHPLWHATAIDVEPGLRVEVIDSFTAFAQLQGAWTDLSARDPDSGLFLSWPWLAEAFVRSPGRWKVLAVREGARQGRYLCFLPLKLRLHWSRSEGLLQTQLDPGGRLGFSEYTGFLCDPVEEDRALPALARHLAQTGWSDLELRYEPTGRRSEIFANAFPPEHFRVVWQPYRINGGETDNLVCPGIALPDAYETWLETGPGSNTRQKIRRFTRKFIDTGELHLTRTDAASFARDLDIMMGFWRAKWAPLKDPANLDGLERNYRQMMADALALDALFMPVLWRGDQPLGVMGGIADAKRGNLVFAVSGRDMTGNDPAIGLLLHAHAIRWAIENGFATYDFGHGDEPYKYTFGAVDARVFNVKVSRRVRDAQVFDPFCTPEALRRARGFLEQGKADAALAVLRQVTAT